MHGGTCFSDLGFKALMSQSLRVGCISNHSSPAVCTFFDDSQSELKMMMDVDALLDLSYTKAAHIRCSV